MLFDGKCGWDGVLISAAVQTVISDDCREAAFSYAPRRREWQAIYKNSVSRSA